MKSHTCPVLVLRHKVTDMDRLNRLAFRLGDARDQVKLQERKVRQVFF